MILLLFHFSKGFYEEAIILLNKAIKGEKQEVKLYMNRGGMLNHPVLPVILARA